MGYGIKFLIIQSPFLKMVLNGEEDTYGYTEGVKERCFLIDKVSDDLFRLSGWTIDFIAKCKTLFKIHTDEEDEFWGNIYVWRYKVRQMEWSELKAVVEPLIDEFVNSELGYKLKEEEMGQIIYTLEKLYSIADIADTFQIC
jgi:hypothetical protein